MFSSVFIVLNIKDEIEFNYPSVSFLCIVHFSQIAACKAIATLGHRIPKFIIYIKSLYLIFFPVNHSISANTVFIIKHMV